MRVTGSLVCLITLLSPVALGAAEAAAAVSVREAPADVMRAVPKPMPVRRSSGFDVALSIPDRFTATQGAVPTAELWNKTILAATRSVVVVGGDFPPRWLEPLFQLRELRPEVSVRAVIDRGVLGPGGELAERLVAAGIRLSFSSAIATMAGYPNEPAVRSLTLIRDDQCLLVVCGLSAESPRETWLQGWLLECPPAAKAFTARVDNLSQGLPAYPEAKNLLLSDR